MIAIPAIDVKEGLCAQGFTGTQSDSSRDVLQVARRWTDIGFGRLHVLDLDAGTAKANDGVVENLLRGSACDVQVAGAVNSGESVRSLLEAGASHVVLADRALDDDDWLSGVAAAFPSQLIVATDVRERRVNIRGWIRTMPVDVMDI